MAHALLRTAPSSERAIQISMADWDDPSDVARVAKELHRRGQDANADFEAKVLQNMEFLAGNQWLVWNKDWRRMQDDRRNPGWWQKLVFNRVLPAHQMRKARLIRYSSTWEVR